YGEETSSSGYTRFGIQQQTTSAQLIMRDSESSAAFIVTTTNQFVNNTWYYFVGTFDDASNNLLMYVNGAQVGSNVAAKGSFTNTTPFSKPQIAAQASGFAFKGSLDEIRTSSIARSPA